MALLPAYLKISALLSRLLGVQGSGGLRRDSNPRVGCPLFPPLIPKMVGGLSFRPISTRLSFHRTCLVQCTGSNPGQYYFNQESRKDSNRVLRRWSPAWRSSSSGSGSEDRGRRRRRRRSRSRSDSRSRSRSSSSSPERPTIIVQQPQQGSQYAPTPMVVGPTSSEFPQQQQQQPPPPQTIIIQQPPQQQQQQPGMMLSAGFQPTYIPQPSGPPPTIVVADSRRSHLRRSRSRSRSRSSRSSSRSSHRTPVIFRKSSIALLFFSARTLPPPPVTVKIPKDLVCRE
ncbi:hypothetical protein B0H15DRAFT_803306 [Mycena belliarum]|uniref:Uncharacterized protein n=1 Tax=Mycena belliarum TaxID=1033014 RepID=A0AAD6TYN8_9AGAR|nr:hypothetical protein B0H15DRAFT_803306 [Mycena belliae]